ncbi:hypothetical protein LEP1GSC193_0248 [Leptospira alstonii serovar Pingchang str. 80-412]|uniref:Uncharacterized protein n=2 Tax=Leptospira alstonii TaxID=28452 RepID=M6D0T3_9LEPT|nr:hypothetical protein LEP1GSC194_3768 [Leptospira alstonii serovar Sichuan str. 79601]EQA81943.1 hypothetical protein LEP1GSC193_0248 [Leptospira alstonii serovar Pingchang str. 80-412]
MVITDGVDFGSETDFLRIQKVRLFASNILRIQIVGYFFGFYMQNPFSRELYDESLKLA